jgi:MFS transporter, UMF1 family
VGKEDIKAIVQGDKKVIRGWVMYDWANSVYQLTVTTAFFPLYYGAMTSKGGNFIVSFFGFEIVNTVLYSLAIAASYLIVAVLSPLLSSTADYTGRRKGFMRAFTWIGAVGCGMLFFFNENNVEFGIIAFMLGTIGYCGSIVFYNSFLPVIAAPEDQDRISARGYSMGYLGGVVLLVINLAMVIKPTWFGIPEGTSLPYRISFITVFLWWIGFSTLTFTRLPKYTYRKKSEKGRNLSNGYRELQKVFFQIRKSYKLSIYLMGFFFMMMGLITVMFMATSYGEKEVGLTDKVLIPTLLIIQLVGMFGAWLFARISGWLGNLKALVISLVSWTLICWGAYYITDAAGFITVAFFIGIVMGGSQSLARSTYSKMLPETTDHTSFFSFYDVMEKVATASGTFSFGIIEAITGSMRYSVLAIGIFFLIGLVFMMLVLKKRTSS